MPRHRTNQTEAGISGNEYRCSEVCFPEDGRLDRPVGMAGGGGSNKHPDKSSLHMGADLALPKSWNYVLGTLPRRFVGATTPATQLTSRYRIVTSLVTCALRTSISHTKAAVVIFLLSAGECWSCLMKTDLNPQKQTDALDFNYACELHFLCNRYTYHIFVLILRPGLFSTKHISLPFPK